MADRHIVYPAAIPLETDLLNAQKHAHVGLGWLAQSCIGTGPAVSGLAVSPTVPASMNVQVGAGAIYVQSATDGLAYGSLGIDTATLIVKQGLLKQAQALTLAAPSTVGTSVNYLIQAGFAETDANPVVLPYYNAANPAVAYSGPSGSGAAQNTTRQNAAVVQAKPGVAATTGLQTTPSPDPGYVGLYVVTIPYGTTSITSGNITPVLGAPVIPATLMQVPGAVQDGRWLYAGATTGTNAYAATLSPAPTSFPAGMEIVAYFATPNTTTAPTLNINGLGARPVLKQGGGLPSAGDLSGYMRLVSDSQNWRVNGPVASDLSIFAVDTGSADALVATCSNVTAYTAGQLVVVQKSAAANGTATPTLNINDLGAKAITKPIGTPLYPGDLPASARFALVYDGSAFRHLGPVASTTALQTQAGQAVFASLAGTNAYTGALNPAPAALTANMQALFNFVSPNTAAGCSINLNGLGSAPVVKQDGTLPTAGDLSGFMAFTYTGAAWQALQPLRSDILALIKATVPTPISADVNIYVNAGTGSDANPGTSAAPLQTLQAAVSLVQRAYSLGAFAANINCTGNFTAGVIVNGGFPGAQGPASVKFKFATGSTVSVSNSACFISNYAAAFSIEGQVTLSATGSSGTQGVAIYCNGGNILYKDVIFGVCGNAHIVTANGGFVTANGNYTIAGGANFHINCTNFGNAQAATITITLANSPAFDQFFVYCLQGQVFVPSVTFSGAATGYRYYVDGFGMINTGGGGANYLAGSAAGTQTATGSYR